MTLVCRHTCPGPIWGLKRTEIRKAPIPPTKIVIKTRWVGHVFPSQYGGAHLHIDGGEWLYLINENYRPRFQDFPEHSKGPKQPMANKEAVLGESECPST
jgi:hypothetical protein